MTDNSKYNNGFTADDIERYHSGKMSPIEMHQLEKAAMEDPFLSDALEGYAYTQTPAEDRAWLQSQLQSKTEGAKVVPMIGFNRGRFLKIAAMLVLLIGCAWGVYRFGFKTKETDLAVSKIPAAETDTPLREHTTPAEATLNQSAQNADANTNASIGTDDTNVSTQQTTVENKGNGTVALSIQNRHTGRISGNEGEETASLRKLPLRAKDLEATITSAEESTSSKIDSNAGKQDQLDEVVAATAPQTVTPGKENVIVLQRNKNAEPIPEVVLGNKSMKDSTYRKPVITFEEAVPEKGSKYFDDYVAQNLQLPEEELRKNISGEVKLSFDVNASGEAVNIAVVKSLCTECDKEAIRLLQQGPKWLKKKNEKKGTVSIKF
jgi:TonB family protein